MIRAGRASALCGGALLAIVAAGPALAAEVSSAGPQAPDNGIAEGSDIVVTATEANKAAPVTASLQTTQPQAIVSRSFIEDSLPATADFNAIALITPSVSNNGGTNGIGLSESKMQIRGFQDGEYNITYDGVPFGDTNDPTHHSNTFFPSNTIETLVVDRGPGNASQLGQATFGGNVNMFSRETRADLGGELKAAYGTDNSYLLRGLFQTGAIDKLGGTEMLFSAQHVATDGHMSHSPYHANNVFGKIMIPIGPDVKLTILGTYNENRFNQPDKDGATLTQVALYGKNFSLNNDPTSQNYYKYNHTHKTTDFEIVKLEANLSPHATLENRAYTYSYDNETLSGNDVTLTGTLTAADVAKANMVTLADGKTKVPGVPGYTKSNDYRVYGDILKFHWDFGIVAATVGGWFEHSNTFRQQTDVDLATGNFDYREKKVSDPATGVPTPQYVRFNQNSQINHVEGFGELAIKPIDGLVITPGVKHVEFNRKIDALYNQTTRYPQKLSNTYSATLPFVTINYAPTQSLALYAQYARGFLIPSLTVLYVADPSFSTVAPERSTNYQLGAVYHGSHISLDADVYYIDFSNKFASRTDPVDGLIWYNQGSVIYKGVEGQVTYAFDNGLALFANGSRNYAKTDNSGAPHTQVPNAPFWTAAAGILYKHGPIRFSLIDKYTGPQYAVDNEVAGYRIGGYNTANLSASYDFGRFRVGVDVTDLFDSTHVTNINQGKLVTRSDGLIVSTDQYYFQPGRAVSGEVTVRF